MWRQAHRETYKQSGRGLPSDLTDVQWERLEPLIPAETPSGRARKTDMLSAMNGIFYLLRTGCPWRSLPRGAFPPRSTVYNIFRQFQRDGGWERIWEELPMALREALGREASPTAAILDSQSLKAAEKGEPRAGVKRTQWVMTPGRRCRDAKCTPLVDVEGLPLRVIVHSAGMQDRDGAALVLDKIRQRFPWLELVWADAGYNARQVKDAVARLPGLRLEIVKRSDDTKGFVVLPRRWVVERTFSWFGRNRRLAKDYENLAETLAAFITLAAIQFAIRRLARA